MRLVFRQFLFGYKGRLSLHPAKYEDILFFHRGVDEETLDQYEIESWLYLVICSFVIEYFALRGAPSEFLQPFCVSLR